ncbi:alpha/beta-hydrolase [Neoconidiobolus thromboides FSU 785]|nr:alpha/beta-hydrolase [Neoconidiobolus thromboides FSU 785]
MVSTKNIILFTLSFGAAIYKCQNPDIIEGTDETLPVKENDLYPALIGEESTNRQETRGLFEDLPLLEKRVPSKKLIKPRNVTTASIEKLHSNYQYSVLSICPEALVRNGNCICSRTFLPDSFIREQSKDLYAVTGVDPAIKTVIVSYRGTKSIKNWQTNFDYEQIQYPGANNNVLVHKGFYEATVAIQNQLEKSVLSLLKDPKYKGYKLQITGISLGAALSTVSSLRWKKFLQENNLNSQMEVFAYSSPRVGNEGFAQYIADAKYPLTRYTNLNDIVPHLPPRSFNYVHVAAEIYERRVSFGRTEFVYCDQSFDEDPNCGQSQQGPYSLLRHAFVFNKIIKLPIC